MPRSTRTMAGCCESWRVFDHVQGATASSREKRPGARYATRDLCGCMGANHHYRVAWWPVSARNLAVLAHQNGLRPYQMANPQKRQT